MFKQPDNLTPFHDPSTKELIWKYRPLNDFAFIFPILKETIKKKSIIEIPEHLKKSVLSDYGIVLAIGPGWYDKRNKFHSTDMIKPGMKVLYDKTVPWDIKIKGLDGTTYRIMMCTYKDIKGIVD